MLVPLFLYYLAGFPLLILFGWVVVSALVDFEERSSTLRCFHCGCETEVGRKICQHCHSELQ